LVELLVALAILSMLVGSMVQLTNITARTINESNKRLDATTQCRMTLDRMAFDFAGMLKRNDIDYTFTKTPGDDSLSFYGQTTGLFPAGTTQTTPPPVISVVGYRITNDATLGPRLERGAKGMDWDQMVFTPLTGGTLQQPQYAEPNSLPLIDAAGVSPSNFQVLGDQVVRFEYCFLTKGDATTHEAPKLVATFPGSIAKVSAIVVGIVILDKKSRVTVKDYTKLVNAFPDAVDGQDIASLWLPIINSPNFAKNAGLSVSTAQAVTVCQHYFFLK
jgi:hypothetical protein